MCDWTVLFFCILFITCAVAQRDCTDLRGRLVSHGIHYVPGPDTCTLCVCDNGVPLECKAVLCSPPQVLVALAFYATGSYQRAIGDMASHSIAQETVSAVLTQVTNCLNLPYFREKYIKFPKDVAERRTNIIEFNNKFGMPGVLGCIDCTHIAIVRPIQNEERYYSRKQYHSLNVQLDCRSFRVGVTCCEFICLDDVVKPAEGAEANVRVAAGGAAAVVLATVLLVLYRVRKQKRRRATHAEDQRSLTSIGYISGSMAYMSSTCETALGGWKPPGNYLPRGEAPPPYDEVVAQCRAENARLMSEGPYHRSYPATVEAMTRTDDIICNGHGYVMPRPVQQVPNGQNCYNAPLLQTVHPAEVREVNPMPHYPLAPNMSGLGQRGRLTGSLGAISGRLAVSVPRESLPVSVPVPDHERPHNVPGFYTNTQHHTALHRTIPRISTAMEALELGAFRRAETMGGAGGGHGGAGGGAGAGEVRRSFHRPPTAARRDTARSVPRHLDLASASLAYSQSSLRLTSGCSRSRAQSTDNVGGSPPPPALSAPVPAPVPNPASVPVAVACAPSNKPEPLPTAPAPPPSQSTLPLTVDKPSCECSYAGGGDGSADGSAPAATTAGDEHDDYRNECENCKSANSSRWVLEEGWDAEEEEGGTQTLQRRAPPPSAAPPAPATATLPQPVTKQRTMGPPSNWENWFNTIPDSDSESEEE